MITFFDVPSKLPGIAWSPINWRIRLILNYKQLPHKTEWIEYPDIEAFSKKHGIAPTGKKPDGNPLYTFPAIYDDTTGAYLADSVPIAQYLDKTYPDTPVVVPAGTEALMQAFLDSYFSKWGPYMPISVLQITTIMNPVSSVYFNETRPAYFNSNKTLQEIAPKGEARVQALEAVKSGMEDIKKSYDKNGGKKFIMGDSPTFTDFAISAFLLGVKLVYEEDSHEWKEVSSWQGGRWAKLLEDMKPYQAVF
ncbi:hypothetical protein BDQ17DRAFT_1366903 [Cyathus striatus]|nr:hypothetical protein BDQ17DRAFT_1366903 [Cyathus striatus]